MARSKKVSAGLLMYRRRPTGTEVFLVHPGGPYHAHQDAGSWSIPKGEPGEDEDLEVAACREFAEETGKAPSGPRIPLGTVRQRGGKTVHAWAFAGDWEADRVLVSNTFELEWPPRSGVLQVFPEVDRGAFFSIEDARQKINVAQAEFLGRLLAALGATG